MHEAVAEFKKPIRVNKYCGKTEVRTAVKTLQFFKLLSKLLVTFKSFFKFEKLLTLVNCRSYAVCDDIIVIGHDKKCLI